MQPPLPQMQSPSPQMQTPSPQMQPPSPQMQSPQQKNYGCVTGPNAEYHQWVLHWRYMNKRITVNALKANFW